jgi:hypothetical protein
MPTMAHRGVGVFGWVSLVCAACGARTEAVARSTGEPSPAIAIVDAGAAPPPAMDRAQHVGAIRCGSDARGPVYCRDALCCQYDDGTGSCHAADFDCWQEEKGWPDFARCDGSEDCAAGEYCLRSSVMSSRGTSCKEPPEPQEPSNVMFHFGGYTESTALVCNAETSDCDAEAACIVPDSAAACPAP